MTEDEQAFWDQAYCAALAGLLGTDGAQAALLEISRDNRVAVDSATSTIAGQYADAALSARRLHTEKDKP